MASKTRRFIAGAVCPGCGEIDKTAIDLETDQRICVKCGYTEARPKPPKSAELATRVSRAKARRIETPSEPVRLLDPDEAGK